MSDVSRTIRIHLRYGGQASERDLLSAAADDIARLERELRLMELAADAQASEFDWLERELAQCRADAERYRWLRHGDNDERVLKGAYVGVSFLLRNEKLDAAIDAARASERPTVRP